MSSRAPVEPTTTRVTETLTSTELKRVQAAASRRGLLAHLGQHRAGRGDRAAGGDDDGGPPFAGLRAPRDRCRRAPGR